MGQCTQCGEWNTLVEEVGSTGSRTQSNSVKSPQPISLASVRSTAADVTRLSTTISELDRVLGSDAAGGVVAGSVTLLGGAPGIGKSTLLTQVAMGVATMQSRAQSVVYVCGEENPEQIYVRINRIQQVEQKNNKNKNTNKKNKLEENLVFLNTTDVDEISLFIERTKPVLVIVDSIQTLTTADLTGAAGSVGQVRETAQRLVRVAKHTQTPLFLVGHITKEGKLAGPMVLEHVVDTVLELTGDRNEEVRLLRATKNRFGVTDEVGVFRMKEEGYESIANPSEIFLDHAEQQVPGAAVACVLEGSRPLLVVVQALAVRSYLPAPRRVGRGIDTNRLHVLSAVLEKHLGLPLSSYDIFVSLTGGLVTREPAVDLAVCLAVVSSIANQPLSSKTVCIGEVGLLGEIRKVPLLERRTREAGRLGYTQTISASHGQLGNALKTVGISLKDTPTKRSSKQ